MTIRYIFILGIFYYLWVPLAVAQEESKSIKSLEQVMESLSKLRNPFISPIVDLLPPPPPPPKPEPPKPVDVKPEPPKPIPDISSLKLTINGIVWGTKDPQAIIDNE